MKKRILILAMLALVLASQAVITDQASLRAALAAVRAVVNDDASRAQVQSAIQDLSNYIGGRNLILLTKEYPDRNTGAAKQAVQLLIDQGRAALDLYAANKDAALGQSQQARQALTYALQQVAGENQDLRQRFVDLQGELAASQQVSQELQGALEQNRIAKDAQIAQLTERLRVELAVANTALAQARDVSNGYRARIDALNQQLQAEGVDAKQLSALQTQIQQLTQKLAESEQRGETLDQQAAQIAVNLGVARQEIERLTAANKDVNAQRAAQLAEVQTLPAELEALRTLNKTVSASSSSKGSVPFAPEQLAQLQQLQTELQASKAAATVSEANVKRAQEENQRRQIKIDELHTQLQALQAQVEAATAQVASSMTDKQVAVAVNVALEVELAAARSAIAQAGSDLIAAQARFDQDRLALEQAIRREAGRLSDELWSRVELLDKENAQLRAREAALTTQLEQFRIDKLNLDGAQGAVDILGVQLHQVSKQRDALRQELESIRLAAGESSASAAVGAAAAGGPPIVVGAGGPPPSAFSTASSSGAAAAGTLKRLSSDKGEDKGAVAAVERPKMSLGLQNAIQGAVNLKKVEDRFQKQPAQSSSSAAAGGGAAAAGGKPAQASSSAAGGDLRAALVQRMQSRRGAVGDDEITADSFIRKPSSIEKLEDLVRIKSDLLTIAQANGTEVRFQELFEQIKKESTDDGWGDVIAPKKLLEGLANLLKLKKK